jgi:transcriptional regulator with XRE-family HTH domain
VTPIEHLAKYIGATHPDARLGVTPPLHEDGTWSLDIDVAGHQLVIQWNLATGFGVTSPSDESFGERPDEAFRSLEDVQRRLDKLLAGKERTSPPLGVLLSRLRERRGSTQKELASSLGIQQATVSGMERRADLQVSTLKKVIEALGGILEIFADFPDGRYRLAARSIEFNEDMQAIALPKYTLVHSEAPNIRFEEVFKALQESGELSWATSVARDISARHAVLDVP